jgi:hypothetical protein
MSIEELEAANVPTPTTPVRTPSINVVNPVHSGVRTAFDVASRKVNEGDSRAVMTD